MKWAVQIALIIQKLNNLNNIFHTQNKETQHEKITFKRNVNGLSFCCECTRNHFCDGAELSTIETTNEKGEIIGFDVDVANAICKEIQATCHFKSQAFDALIPSLKSKRFDAAISAIDITEARAKQVAFSNAYYDSSASYVALKGKADLASAKTVGVQNGTTFQQYTAAEPSNIMQNLMQAYKMRS